MIDLGLPEYTDAVEIGRGGFGVVYRATQRSFGRTVAIKVLSVVDAETIRRFDRERLALGPVSNHPNIVQVFASGLTERGQPYLAMEFMDGGSLDERVSRRGPIQWATVLDAAVKLAGALETAHRAGITHRDLKPANVLLSEFGEPHLADFGIASIEGGEVTRSGVITASINFAPPEVLEGKRPGVVGDIYSFGATLFTVLSGRVPFAPASPDGESVGALALRVASAPVPDLRDHGVPGQFAQVIEKAMAKRPDERHQSAASLGRALQDTQRMLGLPITALPIAHIESPDSPPLAGATRHFDSASISNPTPGPPLPPTPTPAAADAGATPGPVSTGPVAGSEAGVPLAPAPTPPRDPKGRRIALGVGAVLVAGLVGAGLVSFLSGDEDGQVATDPAGALEAADDSVEPAAGDAPSADEPEALADDEQYEPSAAVEGGWSVLPPMNTERQQLPAIVTSTGKIWMAGGLDAFAYATRSVEYFDPLLQTWAMCDCDLPIALNHHMGATWQGEPVVLGGWVGVDEDIKAESSARVLRLQGDEWVDLPPLNEPRVAGVAVTVGDEIIVTGGQDAQGDLMTTTEIFDGEAWRYGADLPTPREHVAAATDGRYVYVVGGRRLPGGSAANLATFERYDPATDGWTSLPDMPTARGGLAAVWGNNAVIALGGEGPSDVFDQVEQYNPGAGTWEELPPLGPGRHGLAAAFFRRTLYALGGALEASHLGSTSEVNGLRVAG